MYHNCYTLNILPIDHKCYFVTFENSERYEEILNLFGNIFFSKNRSAYGI